MSERPRILLDCDPGIDDAFAIFCALRFTDLAAVTTVSGNVRFEHTTRNALYVLELAEADVPVHRGAAAPLSLAAMFADPDMGFARAALISVVGCVWLALAGLVVAQASGMTDISPISGMSLIGVTIMFFLTDGNVATSIILGVAVSIGIGQCADMMADLKAGHLIGATPRLQQLAQFSFAWLGVPVAIGVLYLIWNGPGFGPGNPDLSAPQGAALAAVMEGLTAGDAPVDKYAAGMAIGLAMGVFPISGMGVLVGLAMYLPFYITLTYGVGCFSAMALERARGHTWMATTIVPIAAGFIIGEALVNLTLTLVTLGLG